MNRITIILLALIATFFVCLFFGCSVKKKATEKSKVTVNQQTEVNTEQAVKTVDRSTSETRISENVSEEYTEEVIFSADSVKVHADGSKTIYKPQAVKKSKGSKETGKETDNKVQNNINQDAQSSGNIKSKSDSSYVKKVSTKEVKGQTFGQSIIIAVSCGVVFLVFWLVFKAFRR